jgi:hypothetical protein
MTKRKCFGQVIAVSCHGLLPGSPSFASQIFSIVEAPSVLVAITTSKFTENIRLQLGAALADSIQISVDLVQLKSDRRIQVQLVDVLLNVLAVDYEDAVKMQKRIETAPIQALQVFAYVP